MINFQVEDSMLNEIHFLLTYTCLNECDHCFLYCGPESKGTFTVEQLRQVFVEIAKIDSIDKVYFEGGEAFLYYPLLLEGIRLARARGLAVGIVTNSYWATSVADAELWLKPLVELGIADISMSDDSFHFSDEKNPAKFALQTAKNLGMAAGAICIEEPTVAPNPTAMGEAVVGGGVIFRGRAVEKLSQGLPTRPAGELTTCPFEDLENPGRVHLDAFGHLHLCQGLSMGNIWKTPLSELVKNYSADRHPVCAPLLAGGPQRLAQAHSLDSTGGYIAECHYCYEVRKQLLDKYPDYLAPRQVYGVQDLL
ncbi:MAG: radical SAM protein [Candidatus Neomarinimicrobiota bacterium]